MVLMLFLRKSLILIQAGFQCHTVEIHKVSGLDMSQVVFADIRSSCFMLDTDSSAFTALCIHTKTCYLIPLYSLLVLYLYDLVPLTLSVIISWYIVMHVFVSHIH